MRFPRWMPIVITILGLLLTPASPSIHAQAATPATDSGLATFVAEIPFPTNPVGAPSGLAVAADGTLYVIDSLTDQIRVFSPDGAPVATWGQTGTAPGQFRFQADDGYYGDLALGPDDLLYVLDHGNNRVQVLRRDGSVVRTWGQAGAGDGEFAVPEGIAVDPAGRVYVADTGNGRLQIFAGDGQFVSAWSPTPASGGRKPSLADVAVDAAGDIWISDEANSQLYHLGPDGTPRGVIGTLGAQPGQLIDPWGVAVDAAGRLYVAEYLGNRVQVFAPDGTPLGIVGGVGDKPGRFTSPIYLTVSAAGGLYVADEGNHRVQRFQLDPPLAAAATPNPG